MGLFNYFKTLFEMFPKWEICSPFLQNVLVLMNKKKNVVEKFPTTSRKNVIVPSSEYCLNIHWGDGLDCLLWGLSPVEDCTLQY